MGYHSRRPLEAHEIAGLLSEARARTLLLIAPLSEEDLRIQHSPLMSPVLWDLGHIAHFEEVWLLEKLAARADDGEGLRGIYDPFENPRSTRDDLPLPSEADARRYLARVRRRVLTLIDREECRDAPELFEDGFVFRMVLQHEYQHNETILQTLQLKKGGPYPAPRAIAVPEPVTGATPAPGVMCEFPGGEIPIGSDDRSTAYDNERPRHRRTLDPFLIDANPVTCGQYLEFMDDGGYERRELWSEPGWRWAREQELDAPMYWERDGEGWGIRFMDRRRPLRELDPVCNVCYHEAEAYARWAGKRLPTEFEWEAAAAWDPRTGERRQFPWGSSPPTPERANVDQLLFETAPVGSYPANVSPIGCYGMIGDVWEWTSSHFRGYPGFRSFPYEEYSETFFGTEHRVLRGGSWATRPGAVRTTFRNWDFPIRRQIFAGFRCARSVAD